MNRKFNELVIFGGHNFSKLASEIHAECIQRTESHKDYESTIEFGAAETKPFPNGESYVRLHNDVRDKDVFVVLSTCRLRSASISLSRDQVSENPYTGVNDNLMELFVWGDTLKRASAGRITAVIPYFGYARQDRKAASRTPITARLVANLLEKSGFDRVLTVDLHAGQIQGFFDIPLDHLTAAPIFADKIKELDLSNPIFLSPDVGNMKKADKLRQAMPKDIELAVIDKRRGSNGDIKVNRLVGEVEGCNVIMSDDMISTASTMRAAIDLATKYGAKDFHIFASHGEFVGKAIANLDHPKIANIFVTDSVAPQVHIPKLQILSISSLLSDAILRIHQGDSISELLGRFG